MVFNCGVVVMIGTFVVVIGEKTSEQRRQQREQSDSADGDEDGAGPSNDVFA